MGSDADFDGADRSVMGRDADFGGADRYLVQVLSASPKSASL